MFKYFNRRDAEERRKSFNWPTGGLINLCITTPSLGRTLPKKWPKTPAFHFTLCQNNTSQTLSVIVLDLQLDLVLQVLVLAFQGCII